MESGKIVTAAGVSASIDLGLHLASRIGGERLAQIIQLALEYDPAPPFDVGSPAKAPPEVRDFVAANVEAIAQNRMRSRPVPHWLGGRREAGRGAKIQAAESAGAPVL